MPTRQPLCQIQDPNNRRPANKAITRKSQLQPGMVRKPPSLSSVSTTSQTSFTYPPSVLSQGWDADDEDSISMSGDDWLPPPRPLSVSLPKGSAVSGPYCPRRPNLREILANTSEAPWTLAAFMAYLSSNHCLEILEFIMDAGRYKKHYAKMLSRASTEGGSPSSKDKDYVQSLWERLVEAYIRPSGSREVNIPSSVRDPILALQPGQLPPSPEALEPAVAKVYELMEDSVLVPFLNSAYPSTPYHILTSSPPNMSNESLTARQLHFEDRSPVTRRISGRSSPQQRTNAEPQSRSHNPSLASNRKSAPPNLNSLNKAISYPQRSQRSIPPTSSSRLDGVTTHAEGYASGSGPGMTDDSGSTDSPANDSPTTPPARPAVGQDSKRDSGMWKRLGRLGGIKTSKKKSDSGLREAR